MQVVKTCDVSCCWRCNVLICRSSIPGSIGSHVTYFASIWEPGLRMSSEATLISIHKVATVERFNCVVFPFNLIAVGKGDICTQAKKLNNHLLQIFLPFYWPTTWPGNNCLQKMVCSCTMSSNFVWLQIIFGSWMHKWNHVSLHLVIARVKVADRFASWSYSFKKQTWWSNDQTITDLCYHKILWFVRVPLATDKSWYFAQPHPIIIVNYLHITFFCNCIIWITWFFN